MASTTLAPDSALSARPRVGQFVGKYRLLELLGEGATSRVFRAEHLFLKREVSIKILACDFGQWPDFDLDLFERTAAAAARLDHPGIVRIYDIDEEAARPFIVMEYVRGESLHHCLAKKGRLGLGLSVSIAVRVALALAHAHKAGLIHCDIKPANILLSSTGRVKVTDFGLAQLLAPAEQGALGWVGGTPAYMAPEQMRGAPASPRSDIYSLGATFLEMLTGRTPAEPRSRWRGDSWKDILRQIPPQARSAEPVLLRMLAPNPEDRYTSARDFLRGLSGLLSRGFPSARPLSNPRLSLIRGIRPTK